MEILINILKGWLLAWMFVNFEPIQNLIAKYVKPFLFKNKFTSYFGQALSCHKCMSFWTILLMTENVYYAISGAILAYVFEKIMSSFKTYL